MFGQFIRASHHINYHRFVDPPKSVPVCLCILFWGALCVFFSRNIFGRAKVECNLCGWKGKKFLNFYSGYGHVYPNSVCARCFSQPRHRSYVKYLAQLLDSLPANLKVLHFAPEPPITKFLLKQKSINYLSVDIDPFKAMRKEDITQLSFEDESFDLIICIHVFEHIENDKQAMQEIFRVLRKNGVALLDVPLDEARDVTYEDSSITTPEARTKAFWQWDHLRLYGKDYVDKLHSVGFIVKEDNYIKSLGKDKNRYFGLSDSVSFLCTK